MQLERRHYVILLIAAVAVIMTSSYIYAQKMSAPAKITPSEPVKMEQRAARGHKETEAANTTDKIVVYVSGAVAKPGVVSLAGNARAVDAVQAAGGLAVDADTEKINLAQPLRDGMHINVPHSGGNGVSPGTAAMGQSAGGRVNINTAGVAELDTLPGIGPALAQRIVDYRTSHGLFVAPEDLKKVSGIGESKFERLKEHISL